MNLLLLLSALLSGLTGVGATGRAQDRVPTVAEASLAAARAVVSTQRRTERPVAALPTLVASAAAPAVNPLPLAADKPLYATRRRE